MRITNAQVEQELRNLPVLNEGRIRKYISKPEKSQDRLIIFKQTGMVYCTRCRKWHKEEKKDLKKIRLYDKKRCECCGANLKVIYQRNTIENLGGYVYALESNDRKELIIRLYYYNHTYVKQYGDFKEVLIEVERWNFDRDIAVKKNTGKNLCGCIYHYENINEPFVRDRTKYCRCYFYKDNFQRPSEIRKVCKNTNDYKYACIDIVAKNKMDLTSYIQLYKKKPKVELLLKAGCINAVADAVKNQYSFYARDNDIELLDRLNKQQMNILVKNNMNMKEASMMLRYNMTDYDLIRKAAAINYFDVTGLEGERKRIINYIFDKNFSIRDYEDYIGWCRLFGMNTNDRRVLYPENPRMAHDDLLDRKTKQENKIYSKSIEDYSRELEKYDYSEKKYMIRPARSQEELINESRSMNNCVRTYAQRMAARITSIFFIRKKKDQYSSYVTLELKGNRVVQCRSRNNMVPEEDIKEFVNRWCNKFNFISCFR